MATQQQISANRENAQASTGPTTPAGKLAVSKNAMRHGLTATSIDQFPAHIQDQFLLLQPSIFQTTTKDSALRITYVEQSRLSRESRPS